MGQREQQRGQHRHRRDQDDPGRSGHGGRATPGQGEQRNQHEQGDRQRRHDQRFGPELPGGDADRGHGRDRPVQHPGTRGVMGLARRTSRRSVRFGRRHAAHHADRSGAVPVSSIPRVVPVANRRRPGGHVQARGAWRQRGGEAAGAVTSPDVRPPVASSTISAGPSPHRPRLRVASCLWPTCPAGERAETELAAEPDDQSTHPARGGLSCSRRPRYRPGRWPGHCPAQGADATKRRRHQQEHDRGWRVQRAAEC